MRIGFTGVSSTGKSTLARRIAAECDLPLLLDQEVHKETWALLKEWNRFPHTQYFPDMTPEEHIDFERAVTKVRLDWENSHSSYVADETPIDFLNYLYIVCSPHPEIISPGELELLLEGWRQQLAQYDLIWYLPFGLLEVEDDGRRFKDKHRLQFWDNAIKGLVQHLNFQIHNFLGGWFPTEKPAIFEMPSANLDARVACVRRSLLLLKESK